MASPPAVPSLASPPDLLVVGAGVIGLAAAHACAKAGARVVVLDRGEPGAEATWATAGMLSPFAEASGPGPFLDFALRSLDLYPSWVRTIENESEVEVEYRECGKLRVARTEAEEAHLVDVHAFARLYGGARMVARGELPSIEPELGPSVRAGLLIERDARVDGRRLAEALASAARQAGVTILSETSVLSIVWRSPGWSSPLTVAPAVEGVFLRDGRVIPARSVLISAGAWSGSIGDLPGPLPVRPVRGQMVSLSGGLRIGRSIEAAGVYLTPRDNGRILVGATVEEVGFQKENTNEGIASLLEAAATLVPAVATSKVVETWSGLRPGTPDDLPVIGGWPDATGLFVATGHFRNGVLLAPATAAAVAGLVLGGTSAGVPFEFAPERFRMTPLVSG